MSFRFRDSRTSRYCVLAWWSSWTRIPGVSSWYHLVDLPVQVLAGILFAGIRFFLFSGICGFPPGIQIPVVAGHRGIACIPVDFVSHPRPCRPEYLFSSGIAYVCRCFADDRFLFTNVLSLWLLLPLKPGKNGSNPCNEVSWTNNPRFPFLDPAIRLPSNLELLDVPFSGLMIPRGISRVNLIHTRNNNVKSVVSCPYLSLFTRFFSKLYFMPCMGHFFIITVGDFSMTIYILL